MSVSAPRSVPPTVAVTASDRASNLSSTPLTISHDTLPPVVTMTVPAQAPLRSTLSWSGLDTLAGVRGYEVQVSPNAGLSWTPLVSAAPVTHTVFVGSPGQTYHFRVKATDNVNNESGWVQAGPMAIVAVTKYYALGGQKVAMRQGEEVYYLHGDHLGSTSLTTDEGGNVVSEVRYEPYGEERWRNGEAVTDFGFTGQRNERGFGLMDYQARFYSPVLGRFVSPDSIVPEPTSSSGFNRYRYARNNPLKYVDPSGHFECEDAAGECIAPRPTVQDSIDIANRFGIAIVWPAAIANETTKFTKAGLGYTVEGTIPTIKLLPNRTIQEVPTNLAKVSTALSYGLPVIIGGLNAREIQYRSEAGEITYEEALAQQGANVGFTAMASVGGGAVIPAAAAATGAPISAALVGGVALGYDLSIAQGTVNNMIEGQPLNEAFTNARVETHRSFGISGFDSAAYKALNPILTPILTPIAKEIYNIP